MLEDEGYEVEDDKRLESDELVEAGNDFVVNDAD